MNSNPILDMFKSIDVQKTDKLKGGIIMANSLNKDLRNKRVLLMKKVFKPEYQDEKYRIVKITGGFGAEANTIGRAIFVEFECDGKKARFSGYDVEKLLE